MKARALWLYGEGKTGLDDASIGEGVLVKTLFSGISRGTEKLVFEGRVGSSQWQTMRCNGQEGEFSFPVKYGYCNVGLIQEGEHAGKAAFALYPHQDFFRLPPSQLEILPTTIPAQRAVLAANMETAVNIVWDSGATIGDRICVIGGGVVGALVAYLLAKIPGVEITLIDINPAREELSKQLGFGFSAPDARAGECDVVIHTSASEQGLDLALRLAGKGATVVEASWYGTSAPKVDLGANFHDKRLRLISSQVGSLPSHQSARWSFSRRLGLAISLLADPALDALISSESSFDNLAKDYSRILNDPNTLCHRIRYPD